MVIILYWRNGGDKCNECDILCVDDMWYLYDFGLLFLSYCYSIFTFQVNKLFSSFQAVYKPFTSVFQLGKTLSLETPVQVNKDFSRLEKSLKRAG